eukprot:7492747-Prorocentrum_lima.AAC.1
MEGLGKQASKVVTTWLRLLLAPQQASKQARSAATWRRTTTYAASVPTTVAMDRRCRSSS